MEIPRHVGDYKEFLLMPIGKERRKGKAQSYKKKKKSSHKYFEIAFYLRFNSKLLTKINTYSWAGSWIKPRTEVWFGVVLI